MSRPLTLTEYLASFNACLELGLRSRRRIFLEVCDHLSELVEIELRDGVPGAEAERRAIAAFGSPEEVARSFQAGLAGAIDKRLAVSTRRLHRWMASHRWGAAGVQTVALAAITGMWVAGVALVGAKNPLLAALTFFTVGLWLVLVWSPHAPLPRAGIWFKGWVSKRVKRPVRDGSARDRREHRRLDAETIVMLYCPYSVVLAWLMMVKDDLYHPVWHFMAWFVLFMGFQYAAIWGTDHGLDLAARRRGPSTEDADRQSWEAEHPLMAALFDIWSVALASLALVLVYPAPLEVRAAFVAMVAALTGLSALGICLVGRLKEHDDYAHGYSNAHE